MYRQDTLLTLYRYIPVPLPINKHFLYFQPEHLYVASNTDKSLMRTLTSESFKACNKIHGVYYCNEGNSFMKQPLNCLSSLFERHEHDIVAQCPIQLTDPHDMAIQISFDHAIVYHEKANEMALSCALATPVLSTYTFRGLQRFKIPPSCQLESANLLIHGMEQFYTGPTKIESFVPDFSSIPQYVTFEAHLNLTKAPLDVIKDQKSLHIQDINKLFEDEKLKYTWGLSLAGLIFVIIGFCLFCLCCYCCRKCWSGEMMPSLSRRPPPEQALEMVPMRSTRRPRSTRAARRINLFYDE